MFLKADPQTEILGLHCSVFDEGADTLLARVKWIKGIFSEIISLKLSAAAARDGVWKAGRHREITFFSCISR